MNDYYKILGVPRSASKDEIKQAYRKLAHKYHPDKQGGDEKKFKEVNEAYQVLADERKKAQYDQFGSAFGAQGRGFSGFEGFDFNDIFSEFFGGGTRTTTRTRQRGRDIKVDVIIFLTEAFSGVERDITLKKNVTCGHCGGNKNEPGTSLKTCKICGGAGEIRQTHRTILGSLTQVHECSGCKGAGRIPEKKCAKCHGAGIVQDVERIRVKIPPGIHSGETIAFRGKGEAGADGSGNLYVEVHVEEHPQFERDGDDIYSDLGISFSQAVLGDYVKVTTLFGEAEVKIPSGVESGALIKLQGTGMPRLHDTGRGDHYVRITVKTPKKLTKIAREMFEKLKKEGI